MRFNFRVAPLLLPCAPRHCHLHLKLPAFHHSTPRVMAPKRKAPTSEAATSDLKKGDGDWVRSTLKEPALTKLRTDGFVPPVDQLRTDGYLASSSADGKGRRRPTRLLFF